MSRRRPLVSFEFFPPRSEQGFANLFQTINELRALHPSFVSVTYGAGGSTRQKTVELVERIQRELDIRAMAHLTCMGHTQQELGRILNDLWAAGIRNVLALRGDPPVGQATTVGPGSFEHADQLVAFIRGQQDFCVGVAGFPEGHPQCLNRTRDLEMLKRKVDQGASFIITQLFFDNDDFFRFRDAAVRMGITVPIVAGIMPILNVAQIKRFVTLCGAKIPHPLLVKLESLEQDEAAVYAAGVAHAIGQCMDLLKQDVQGLHFYTLNKSRATVHIVCALGVEHAY